MRALRAGERFTVWEGEDINMVATPTLASDAADLIRRIAEGGHRGIFHCCGGESVDRRTLARRTVDVFGLDGDLLDFGPPPRQPWPVPYDTSLDASATPRGSASSRRTSTSSSAGWSRASRARPDHHGPGRRRPLPGADRGLARRGEDVRQVARRQRDQCGGGGGAARPARGSDHQGRRRRVRPLRARRAARVRRRRPLRRHAPVPADPGRVLRDPPARRLPDPLLPGAAGAGHHAYRG